MFNSLRAKIKKEYFIRIKKKSIEDLKIENWRKQGMEIGENVHIYSDLFSKEPYMISIGDDTTISGNVSLITHDNSISKYLPQYTDTFGRITIGKNCFIGMGSMIMAGVTLEDNCIVAAGSVVTKSFQKGSVIGGTPARLICTVEDLVLKNEEYGFNIRGLDSSEKRNLLLSHSEKFVVR